MMERPPDARLRYWRGKGLAFAVSTAAHLLVLWLILGQHGLGGTLTVGQAQSEGEGTMEVSLVGVRAQAADKLATRQTAAPDQVQGLLDRLQGQDGGTPARTRALETDRPKLSMSELFDEAHPKSDTGGGAPGRVAKGDPGGKTSASPTSSAATGGAAAGSLWGAVEPCWRGVGAPAGVIVSLEIDLDLAGRLRAPPRILRKANLPVKREQLLAEAEALQALATCLPRANKKFTGVFLLDFNGKTGGALAR